MNDENFLERISNYLTADEIKKAFTLAELVEMARAGIIQNWLRENVSEDAADFLTPDEIISWNDDDLRLALCQIFSIEISELAEFDASALSRAILRKHLKEIYCRDNEGALVMNQRELLEALNAGYIVIYLVGGVFQIPLHKGGVTYIGRENALVEVSNFNDVNFDRAEIILRDVQIFVRTPINIECNNSSNVQILRGEKIALDNSMRKVDIYRFLQGRNTFETAEKFYERAQKMKGLVVGEVLLDEKDYNIDWKIFDLKILWHLDFLNVARKFSAGKFFSCILTPEFARNIYERERVQLVYADFVTDGNSPAISKIYMITADGTRIEIIVGNVSLVEKMKNAQGSGGSGSRGYGLDLILEF